MLARVVKIESGGEFPDKLRRITFKVEGAEWHNTLTFNEKVLIDMGIHTSRLDEMFNLIMKDLIVQVEP